MHRPAGANNIKRYRANQIEGGREGPFKKKLVCLRPAKNIQHLVPPPDSRAELAIGNNEKCRVSRGASWYQRSPTHRSVAIITYT